MSEDLSTLLSVLLAWCQTTTGLFFFFFQAQSPYLQPLRDDPLATCASLVSRNLRFFGSCPLNDRSLGSLCLSHYPCLIKSHRILFCITHGNKPTKNSHPGTLYPDILQDLWNILPATLVDGQGMFAQCQSSPKDNHIQLGPYTHAPPSADLLFHMCNKSLPFTDGFA